MQEESVMQKGVQEKGARQKGMQEKSVWLKEACKKCVILQKDVRINTNL